MTLKLSCIGLMLVLGTCTGARADGYDRKIERAAWAIVAEKLGQVEGNLRGPIDGDLTEADLVQSSHPRFAPPLKISGLRDRERRAEAEALIRSAFPN